MSAELSVYIYDPDLYETLGFMVAFSISLPHHLIRIYGRFLLTEPPFPSVNFNSKYFRRAQ